MLILHIGLPKSGTTLLQHRIFARTGGLTFLHRRQGEAPLAIARDLRRYARAGPLAAAWYRRRLVRALAAAAVPGRPLLVSEENVSVSPTGFWQGHDATPAGLAARLATLRWRLGPELRPVRVLIGIRRQDQWLASRYAESSRAFPSFGQADFDRRMERIAAADRLDGSLAWLDYAKLVPTFEAALGPGSVHLVPLEALTSDPGRTLRELGRFVGGADLAPAGEPGLKPGRTRNRLSRGENVWRLRRDRSALTLQPALERRLRDRFAATNRALAAALPVSFEP